MPNHFHGLIELKEELNSKSVTEVIGYFKSIVFHEILKLYKTHDRLLGRLWQRNYYEHIIRDYKDLDNCQAYIRNNPAGALNTLKN